MASKTALTSEISMNSEKPKTKTGPKPMERHQCLIDGCDHKADHPVSGFCSLHYYRMKRTGKPDRIYRAAGTGTITTHGYIALGKNGKKTQEHVSIVESVLGRSLPPGAEIHHINGDKSDNTTSNLVVCPSKAYHKMLHQREASMDACGNPNYRKCPFCKNYDDPSNMTHNKTSRYFYHPSCKTAYNRSRT